MECKVNHPTTSVCSPAHRNLSSGFVNVKTSGSAVHERFPYSIIGLLKYQHVMFFFRCTIGSNSQALGDHERIFFCGVHAQCVLCQLAYLLGLIASPFVFSLFMSSNITTDIYFLSRAKSGGGFGRKPKMSGKLPSHVRSQPWFVSSQVLRQRDSTIRLTYVTPLILWDAHQMHSSLEMLPDITWCSLIGKAIGEKIQ